MATKYNPFTGKFDYYNNDGGSGSAVYYQSGVPSNSFGDDGDISIDLDNGDNYQKLAGVWVKQFGKVTTLFQPIPTNGQTIFTLPSQYSDVGSIQVFVNGNRQKNGEDYTISGVNIIFTTSEYNIESDDEIEIIYQEITT